MINQFEHWESFWNEATELLMEPPSEFAVLVAKVFQEHGCVTLLELGGGVGRDTLYFAKMGFRVTVLEYSESGARTIQNKAEKLGLSDKVEVILHDVRVPLPIANESFDCCYSHMLYCMDLSLGELESLTQEVHRVVKQGGIQQYSVRNEMDPMYRTGRDLGDDKYEIQGFVIRFFDRDLIDRLAFPFQLVEVVPFEEGTLPKRLYRVMQQKI